MKDRTLSRRQILGTATAAGAATFLGATSHPSAQAQPEIPVPDYGPSQAPTISDVKDKVVYVTGGSSGIGLGICKLLFEKGAKVVMGYYSDRHIGDALKEFPENHPRLLAIRQDVMDRDLWPKVADQIEDHFNSTLHILINNAGVGLSPSATAGTLNDWDWGMGVNFMGPVYGINTFVPRMLKSGEGCHIATTTSTSGILPGSSAGIYTVSKIAAVGLMEELRLELRETNIGTTCFVPGLTWSNIQDVEGSRPPEFENEAENEGLDFQITQRELPEGTPPGAQRPQDPVVAARYLLDGILHNDLFVVAQPEYRVGVEARANALLESMRPFKPLPDELYSQNNYRAPIYVQEIAHRRATQNRDIEGV